MEEYKNSSLVVILHCLNSFQHTNYVAFLLLYVRENHKINAVCFPSFHNGCNPACKEWRRLRTGEYKNFNFRFIFLMVFNAIDSPDTVSSSKQPKYVILDYCFISIPLCIILSFPVLFNFICVKPKSMHFVLSSPRWILNLFSLNHSHKLAKPLFNWCSVVWCMNIVMLECYTGIICIYKQIRMNSLRHIINIY